MTKMKVLFLCTGNSCRSQMAEGWLRHLCGDEHEAFSAGTHPKPVHPFAVRVMAEADIDISHHRSKPIEEYAKESFDDVITVCDNAKETCPVFPASTAMLHWSFMDPARAQGTQEEILKVFRNVRDKIHEKIREHFQDRTN